MHRIAAYLAIVLLAAGMATGTAMSARADVLSVGVGLDLTGPGAAMGLDHRDGLVLWADEVNARGGILGQRVELRVLDHGGAPARAADIYEQLAAKGGSDWLLAPADDDAALAARDVAARHDRFLLAGAATADALWESDQGRVMGVLAPAGRQATDFLAMLVLAGVDRLAVAAPEGAYARAAFDGAVTWARRFDLSVVLAEQPVDGDWDGLVRRARQAGAQALAVFGRPDDAEAVALAVRRQGWRPMAVLATAGPCFPDFARRLGPAALGMFTLSLWEYDPKLEMVSDFTARFTRRFGRRPTWLAASAYSAGQVLEAAALRAGSTKADDVARAMASLDMVTVSGRFALEPDGQQWRQNPVVMQWRDDGRHVVWPPAFADARPSFAP